MIKKIKNLDGSIIYVIPTGGAKPLKVIFDNNSEKPVAINLITIDKIINNVKAAEPNGVYYTTDKTWIKPANGITPEVKKKKYTNRQLKCPSCGAPHKETEEKCYWCGNYFISED